MDAKTKETIIGLLDSIREALYHMQKTNTNNLFEDCLQALSYIDHFLVLSKETKPQELVLQLLTEMQAILSGQVNTPIIECITNLDKKVLFLQNEIRDRVQVKWKIVFMPYKSSMWNSMESIWAAAKNDDKCDVRVVPIPYYDLDETHRPKRFHYEGDKFPIHVDITHYNVYCLEEEQPDVIVIHNPYDDVNRVTQVEARYFSRNLVKYTQFLLYTWYYVADSFEELTVNMLAPAAAYANILVQSVKAKEYYIKYGLPSERIIALGSPKIDAVVHSNSCPPTLPENWNRKFAQKKVFLWNTNISEFMHKDALQNAKKFVDTICSKKGCALIWRPHPLTCSTLEAMAPRMKSAYLTFFQYASDFDNLIIDETADYQVAFQISDALISNHSSLIQEYTATGKPILLFDEHFDSDHYVDSLFPLNCNYIVKDKESDFLRFIDLVLEEKDPMYQKRMGQLKKCILNSDGTCGQKVYQYIVKELSKRKRDEKRNGN